MLKNHPSTKMVFEDGFEPNVIINIENPSLTKEVMSIPKKYFIGSIIKKLKD